MKTIAVFASLLTLVFVSRVNAEQCFNSDLRGAYSFVASGTLNGVPFTAAGQTLYHGDGTADGVIQASVDGTVYPAEPWTATYSLSPQPIGAGQTVCVLTKTITIPKYGPLTISFFGTAGNEFKELRFISTTPNTTISGTARKQ